ncbi:MAG: hypothetical protein HKP13_07000 [Gammaproteobacteria bacterium]|nr:hypothetical protein [Gammaproteobacteria bacterium]
MYQHALYLIVLGCALSLSACAPVDTRQSMVFTPVTVAKSDTEKRAVRASREVVINGEKSHGIDFHTLLRSGARLGEHIFGALLDHRRGQWRGTPERQHLGL